MSVHGHSSRLGNFLLGEGVVEHSPEHDPVEASVAIRTRWITASWDALEALFLVGGLDKLMRSFQLVKGHIGKGVMLDLGAGNLHN